MKSRIFAFGLVCALGLLAGCAANIATQQANDAEIAAADDAACRIYGPPESRLYNQCRQNKSLSHDRMSPTPGVF
jgi:hypothetical protein